MSTSNKHQKYHHDDLERCLLDKALQILDAEGFEALTLRRVARDCGVSHMAPYRHYANKDALVQAVLEQVMQSFSNAQAAALTQASDARGQLVALGRAYLQFFLEHPGYLDVFHYQPADKPRSFELLIHNTGQPETWEALQPLVQTISAIFPGESMAETMQRVYFYWFMIHGCTTLVGDLAPEDHEQALKLIEGVVLTSLPRKSS